MEFSRSSYLDAFGNAGGVMGLYGSAIAVILGYFVEIDYTTELIKWLFLEKRTERKFFEEYIARAEEAPAL